MKKIILVLLLELAEIMLEKENYHEDADVTTRTAVKLLEIIERIKLLIKNYNS